MQTTNHVNEKTKYARKIVVKLSFFKFCFLFFMGTNFAGEYLVEKRTLN